MPQTVTVSAVGKSVTALSISMQSPPDMIVGQAFGYQMNAVVSEGTPPYGPILFAAAGLPAGVAIDAAGLISGTPTAAASYSVSATVTDSGN